MKYFTFAMKVHVATSNEGKSIGNILNFIAKEKLIRVVGQNDDTILNVVLHPRKTPYCYIHFMIRGHTCPFFCQEQYILWTNEEELLSTICQSVFNSIGLNVQHAYDTTSNNWRSCISNQSLSMIALMCPVRTQV